MRTDPMTTATTLAGAAHAAAAYALLGAEAGSAALVGASLAVVNVVAFRFVVGRILAAHRAGFLLPLKLLGSLTAVYAAARLFHLDAAGLALGYGALPVGLLVASAATIPSLRASES